jgi:lysophospholipase L1-like esterase
MTRLLVLLGCLGAALALPESGHAQTANGSKLQRLDAPESAQRLQRVPLVSFVVSGVTVRSPVEAQITWSDTGSAPGYDVLRDGSVVHAVSAGERMYVDASLRPNTRYTYQVRARTSPPPTQTTLRPTVGPSGALIKPTFTAPAPVGPAPATSEPPRVTAAVEVVTPRALAPSSVTVSLAPDGATRITWAPRPETQTYLIMRNGAPIRVSSMQTSGVYDDRGLPGGSYTYTVQSLIRAAGGVDVPGESSAPLTLLTRPFNVVAVGDSVMWGQGLAESSKFVTLVRQRLQSQLGKPVRLFLLARSGAELGLMPYPSQFPATAENQAVQELAGSSGEIPRTLPSIMHQALSLAPAQVPPADVDLVLMDGCINDVGVGTILNPTIAEADIGRRTQQLCGPETMDARLAQVHQRYPNARILLTGYFPIVSNLSDLTAVAVLMTNVGALSTAVAPLFGVPLDPVTGAVAGAVTTQVLRNKAVSSSAVFHATSTSALMTSAIGSNQRLGGNRIRFVPIPFAAQNAYAAPDTWLWLVPTPGVPLPNAVDEVFEQRLRACQSVPNMPPACIPASMGHPNVKGALAYANAITSALAEFVPAWLPLHAQTKSL